MCDCERNKVISRLRENGLFIAQLLDELTAGADPEEINDWLSGTAEDIQRDVNTLMEEEGI
jgi:hypothetical protein